MTGLIWFVQVVHYPLFQWVGEKGYTKYQNRHMSLTTYVVGPLMLMELLSSAYFLLIDNYLFSTAFLWGNAILLGIIWLSTALLQVPLHQNLTEKYELNYAQKLVSTNWIRTICWSIRSVWVVLEVISFIR
ncbi:MAG: hypothetical protein AAF363_01295 [Bacteroidota bacterium]